MDKKNQNNRINENSTNKIKLASGTHAVGGYKLKANATFAKDKKEAKDILEQLGFCCSKIKKDKQQTSTVILTPMRHCYGPLLKYIETLRDGNITTMENLKFNDDVDIEKETLIDQMKYLEKVIEKNKIHKLKVWIKDLNKKAENRVKLTNNKLTREESMKLNRLKELLTKENNKPEVERIEKIEQSIKDLESQIEKRNNLAKLFRKLTDNKYFAHYEEQNKEAKKNKQDTKNTKNKQNTENNTSAKAGDNVSGEHHAEVLDACVSYLQNLSKGEKLQSSVYQLLQSLDNSLTEYNNKKLTELFDNFKSINFDECCDISKRKESWDNKVNNWIKFKEAIYMEPFKVKEESNENNIIVENKEEEEDKNKLNDDILYDVRNIDRWMKVVSRSINTDKEIEKIKYIVRGLSGRIGILYGGEVYEEDRVDPELYRRLIDIIGKLFELDVIPSQQLYDEEKGFIKIPNEYPKDKIIINSVEKISLLDKDKFVKVPVTLGDEYWMVKFVKFDKDLYVRINELGLLKNKKFTLTGNKKRHVIFKPISVLNEKNGNEEKQIAPVSFSEYFDKLRDSKTWYTPKSVIGNLSNELETLLEENEIPKKESLEKIIRKYIGTEGNFNNLFKEIKDIITNSKQKDYNNIAQLILKKIYGESTGMEFINSDKCKKNKAKEKESDLKKYAKNKAKKYCRKSNFLKELNEYIKTK